MRQQINDAAKVVTIQFDPIELLEKKKLQKAYKKSIFPDVEALFCDVLSSSKAPANYTRQQAEVFESINVMVGPLLRAFQDNQTNNQHLRVAMYGIVYQAIYAIQNQCSIDGYLKLAPLTQAIGQTLHLEDFLKKASDDQCLCYSFTNTTVSSPINVCTSPKDPTCQNSTTSTGSTTKSGEVLTPPPTKTGGVTPAPTTNPPKVSSCTRESSMPDNMKQFWPEFQGNKTNKIGDVAFEVIYLNGVDESGQLWENSFDIQKLQSGKTPDSNEQSQLTLYTPKFRGKLQTGAYLVEGNEIVNFIPKWQDIDTAKPSDVFIHWDSYIRIETDAGLFYMGDCPKGYSPIGVYQSLEDFNKDLHNCMKYSVSIELTNGKDVSHFNQRTNSKIEVSPLGDIKTIVKMDGKDYFEDRVTYKLFMASQSHMIKNLAADGKEVQILSPVTLVIAHPSLVQTDTYLPFRMLYLDDYNFRDQIVGNITFNKQDTAKFGLKDFGLMYDDYSFAFVDQKGLQTRTRIINLKQNINETVKELDYLIFNLMSQTNVQIGRDRSKIYAIPREEYERSTVFEEPLEFIEPLAIVRENSLKYNNHLNSLSEGQFPKYIFPRCPQGYYPVSFYAKGSFESYKKNTIHCLRDDLIEFYPVGEFPLNGTQTCEQMTGKFVFPLVREGQEESKVSYAFQFCTYFYMGQFAFINGQPRQVIGASLPTLFNFQAKFLGSGQEFYNATAFQKMPFINPNNEKLKFYGMDYNTVFKGDMNLKDTVQFTMKSVKKLLNNTEIAIRSFNFNGYSKPVSFLVQTIAVKENPFYIQNIRSISDPLDRRLHEKEYYHKHWPLKRSEYLTFSNYLIDDPSLNSSENIIVIDRHQYVNTDVFADPERFVSMAFAEEQLESQQKPQYKSFFRQYSMLKEGTFYFPVCPTGYHAVSSFTNSTEGDERGFAVYRENTIHCIKHEYTIPISSYGLDAFDFLFERFHCTQEQWIRFDFTLNIPPEREVTYLNRHEMLSNCINTWEEEVKDKFGMPVSKNFRFPIVTAFSDNQFIKTFERMRLIDWKNPKFTITETEKLGNVNRYILE